MLIKAIHCMTRGFVPYVSTRILKIISKIFNLWCWYYYINRIVGSCIKIMSITLPFNAIT